MNNTNASIGRIIRDSSTSDYFTAKSEGENKIPRFSKQILKKGIFSHPQFPDEKIKINSKTVKNIITAFEDNAFDKVPVLAGTHDEEKIERTVGEVIALKETKAGLNATIEISDELVAKKIKTKGSSGKGLISGVSVSIGPVKTDDGTEYKVALWHLALVTHPHFGKMDDFEELAASLPHNDIQLLVSKQGGNDHVNAENLDQRTMQVRDAYYDQIGRDSVSYSWVKEVHDTFIIVSSKKGLSKYPYSLDDDGDVLFDKPEKVKVQYVSAEVTVTNKNKDKKVKAKKVETDVLAILAEKGIKFDSVKDIKALVENSIKINEIFDEAGVEKGDFTALSAHLTKLSDDQDKLTDRLVALEEENLASKAERDVETQIRAGKITPAMKDSYIELRKKDGDLFASMMENAPVIVNTSENGHNDGSEDHGGGATEEEMEASKSRYRDMSKMIPATNGVNGGN